MARRWRQRRLACSVALEQIFEADRRTNLCLKLHLNLACCSNLARLSALLLPHHSLRQRMVRRPSIQAPQYSSHPARRRLHLPESSLRVRGLSLPLRSSVRRCARRVGSHVRCPKSLRWRYGRRTDFLVLLIQDRRTLLIVSVLPVPGHRSSRASRISVQDDQWTRRRTRKIITTS